MVFIPNRKAPYEGSCERRTSSIQWLRGCNDLVIKTKKKQILFWNNQNQITIEQLLNKQKEKIPLNHCLVVAEEILKILENWRVDGLGQRQWKVTQAIRNLGWWEWVCPYDCLANVNGRFLCRRRSRLGRARWREWVCELDEGNNTRIGEGEFLFL